MDIAKTCLEILSQLGPIDEKVKRVNLELEYVLGKNASRQYMTAVLIEKYEKMAINLKWRPIQSLLKYGGRRRGS